jgi:hypothetical protein
LEQKDISPAKKRADEDEWTISTGISHTDFVGTSTSFKLKRKGTVILYHPSLIF